MAQPIHDSRQRGKTTKKGTKPVDEFAGIGTDFTNAQGLAEKLGLSKPLERIDTTADTNALDMNNPAYAGKRSTDMQNILNMMQQGLAGLSAPENQGLREQAQRSLDTQYATAMRQNEISSARGGVRGAASNAQQQNLDRMRQDSQANLEQDLAVKNIDIQDKRRNDYMSALGGQEQSEQARLKDARDRLLKEQGMNLDQSNRQNAGNVALLSSLVGMKTARKNTAQEYSLAKQGMKRSGGGGGTVTHTGSSGANPNQSLIDALTQIGQSHFGSDLQQP